MKLTLALLAALAAIPTLHAQPAQGSCTFDTHVVKFVDGLALPGHSFFDDTEPATAVYLSTSPLKAFNPDLYVDPASALSAMSRGDGKSVNLITVIIDRNGKLEGLGPSGSVSTGFHFTGGTAKNGRIAGHITGSGGARDESTCDATFDVPLAGNYGAGKPLPADGGEPGNAMRALWTSLQNEDTAATLAVIGESFVDAARKGTMPQFVVNLGNGNNNRVVGGTLLTPTRAILDLDLGSTAGRALALKQNDHWRIQDLTFD